MLIGELADATGVTAKTLRFYEQRGLLPEPARTDGGYRDYPPAAVDRVRFVKDAQATGFTLAQIDEILTIRDGGQPPCDHVATLVDQRLAEVKQRLHELETVRQQLQSIAARAEQSTRDDCDGYCNLIPPKRSGKTPYAIDRDCLLGSARPTVESLGGDDSWLRDGAGPVPAPVVRRV